MASIGSDQGDLHNELAELRSTVSQLERAQAALQSELGKTKTLLTALEQSANGVMLVTTDHIIVYANKSFAEMVGFPGKDLTGQNTAIFDPAQTPSHTYNDMIATISSGNKWHGELSNVMSDGTTYWILISITPILDENQQILYYLGITEDINERKRAEKARIESEERYRALVELAPDFIVVHRDGMLLYANPATYRVFAAKQSEEIVGRSIFEFVHPDAREIVARRMRELVSGKPVKLREIDYVRVDGEVISAEIVSAVIDYEGEPAVLSVGRDVTSRKWMEDTLRVTEAHFRMVVESINDTVFTLDTEGRFTAMYGYSSDPVMSSINKSIYEVVGPDARDVHGAALRKALAGESTVFEWAFSQDDLTIHFQTSMSPLRDEHGVIIGAVGVGRDISELKRAQAALQLWQERYEMAQRAAATGVWDWIVDTGELYGSEMVSVIMGLEPEQFGSTFDFFMQRVYPDDRQIVLDAARDAVFDREVRNVEVRVVLPDGAIRWVLIRGDVVLGEADNVVRLVGIIQEITRRKEIENALRESEERYRLLVELSPEAVLVHRDGIIVYVNAAGMRLFRVDQLEELTGRHIFEFGDQEAHEVFGKRIAVLERGEQVSALEQRIVRADGTLLYVEIISAPIMYEGKLSILSILRDVTARKTAEAALRASEERHRIMLETMPDLIFIMSGDGDYLDIKKSDLVKLAQPHTEMIGKNVRDVLAPDEAEESLARLRRTLEAGGIQTSEYSLTIDDVLRHFESRMVKSGENEVLSVVTDITDRKRAEQRSLELMLERERVELLASFITSASHEFRTPLSIISLKMFLLKGDPPPEKRDVYVGEILDQVEALTALLDALLVMTRIDSQSKIRRKPLDFEMFMTAVCAGMNDQARAADLTLTCEIERPLPPYSGNMAYLQRAFENLLHNAIRHTRAGGAITVTVAHQDEAIAVTIQDTGIGMPEDQMKHIFERFYRGDQSHSTRGFGLGLPFAKVVFERHGGTIELESEPDVGTILRVILPLDG